MPGAYPLAFITYRFRNHPRIGPAGLFGGSGVAIMEPAAWERNGHANSPCLSLLFTRRYVRGTPRAARRGCASRLPAARTAGGGRRIGRSLAKDRTGAAAP